MASFRLKRPPVAASLIALCAAGILCGLGTWQMARLSEKEALLQAIESEAQKPPAQLGFEDLTDDKNTYRYGTLEGRWLFAQSLTLIPRTYKGTAGGHLYTPMVLSDGKIVMVNRGWVPEDYHASPMPRGTVKITGQIIPLPRPNSFTPENPPADTNTQARRLYRLDEAALNTLRGDTAPMAPMILRADTGLENGARPSEQPPITDATKPQINNNHAAYAAFWYGMALVLLVIFVLRFMRETK